MQEHHNFLCSWNMARQKHETVTFLPLLQMSEVYATMLVCLSEEPKNGVLQFVIGRHTANITYLWLSHVRLGLFEY